ncbi:MAG: hypothetical protein HYU29_02570, partial [Chloroflexi bacterium]|nr:hypothetical protein [Chloroflexota bacterium]
GCGVVTQTSTEIDPKGGHKVHVGARVASGSAFPVNVKVSLNGELVRTYSGESNNRVSGRPAPLP